MKWFLLIALVSCSAHKHQAATESDAKPVSPYTVKPCFCEKIFQPVCAARVNYGNSCEAECHGNKTWTEGKCPSKPKK